VQLIFEQIRAGGDRNFGYLLADRDSRAGVLIDPSYSPDTFVQRAIDQGITITQIINTHGHPDHINGNARAVELTGAVVAAHPNSPARPTEQLVEGRPVAVGALRLQVFHVPGHAADHLVLYEPSYGILVTGDLLFVGKVGGTTTDEEARTEWNSLRRLLATIPDMCTVWPGHDYGVRPSSSIGMERKTNPFLLCPDEASFLRLKQEWPEFKKRLGLK
jgi:glyoxylase-like metal-dependent hydrolase (beta-lactamase superfamily II)